MSHNLSATPRFAWTLKYRQALMALCAVCAISFSVGSASALDILVVTQEPVLPQYNTNLVVLLDGMGQTC